eukprot:359290-Chlamydomonas_euryale.AAC.4
MRRRQTRVTAAAAACHTRPWQSITPVKAATVAAGAVAGGCGAGAGWSGATVARCRRADVWGRARHACVCTCMPAVAPPEAWSPRSREGACGTGGVHVVCAGGVVESILAFTARHMGSGKPFAKPLSDNTSKNRAWREMCGGRKKIWCEEFCTCYPRDWIVQVRGATASAHKNRGTAAELVHYTAHGRTCHCVE